MEYTALISVTKLARDIEKFRIVDCRFTLAEPEKGSRDYVQAHIPGAIYAHLERDLCGPVVKGSTGRHPLPTVETFVSTLEYMGIGNESQVVVYDDASGSYAGRLWWMLRWVGHRKVAVLDGGWQAWLNAGLLTKGGVEQSLKSIFIPQIQPDLLVTLTQVNAVKDNPDWRLVDCRAPARYRGEVEPIDAIAGRIPGAINIPYPMFIGPDGTYQPVEKLQSIFKDSLGDIPAERVIFYCGSGVTATSNLVALAAAGFGDGKLYAGSYSEWIADPTRAVARG